MVRELLACRCGGRSTGWLLGCSREGTWTLQVIQGRMLAINAAAIAKSCDRAQFSSRHPALASQRECLLTRFREIEGSKGLVHSEPGSRSLETRQSRAQSHSCVSPSSVPRLFSGGFFAQPVKRAGFLYMVLLKPPIFWFICPAWSVNKTPRPSWADGDYLNDLPCLNPASHPLMQA